MTSRSSAQPTEAGRDRKNRANAHLIAAAPDLLNMLKRLVDLEDGHAGVFTWDQVMDGARAAIAKAEGSK